jgi:hypothetical protein
MILHFKGEKMGGGKRLVRRYSAVTVLEVNV